MKAVLIAQFLSALADNALLFAAIALLRAQAAPDWVTPLLQECFVISFIVLAPFVGPLADTLPKGRVMVIANAVKLAGAAAMFIGSNPLLGYGLAGLGATIYSPAKYGILGEMVGPDRLVMANGLMEGSTIIAILLGTISGGLLADQSPLLALQVVTGCYATALVIVFLVPRLPPAHPAPGFSIGALLREFACALRQLLSNRDAAFSMAGTSLFWGSGATLRFLLVAWVPAALGILDHSTPANLNGAVAVGIVAGAALAGRYITLATVDRVLPAGVAIGLLVVMLAGTHSLPAAIALLILLGTAAGLFVVPINALLQERGHESVGTGHAVAIQNFFENLSMLGMIGIYTLAARAGTPPVAAAVAFGLLVTAGMAALVGMRRARRR